MSYKMPREMGDYVLEFFGCLLPGFIFCSINFLITYALLSIAYINKVDCEFLNTVLGNSQFYAPILVFAISYVVGHMFYRKDPKIPDTESYKKIMKRREFESTQARENWIEFNDTPSSIHLVEYPYNNMKKYYNGRGLDHLTKTFPKLMKDIHRSKNWINLIKCRLRFACPEKIRIITKNEGHIRLMSSAWYGLKYNISLGWFYFAALIAIAIPKLYFNNWSLDSNLDNAISLMVIVILFTILLSYIGRSVISSFLHYMRVREITNILETAFTAQILNEKHKVLFADLKNIEEGEGRSEK